MSNETIAAFLENYNKWRRGDESIEMPSPHEIGLAIDCAVAYLRHDDNLLSGNPSCFRSNPGAQAKAENGCEDCEVNNICLVS